MVDNFKIIFCGIFLIGYKVNPNNELACIRDILEPIEPLCPRNGSQVRHVFK